MAIDMVFTSAFIETYIDVQEAFIESCIDNVHEPTVAQASRLCRGLPGTGQRPVPPTRRRV
jgi:hypothetical protein